MMVWDIWFDMDQFFPPHYEPPSIKRSIPHYPPLHSTLTLSNNIISKIFIMVYNVSMTEKTSEYSFEGIRSDKPFVVNGVVVGQDPSMFDRSDIYKQNFEKIGYGRENIKVVNNFLSEQECKDILEYLKTEKISESVIQWDHEFKPVKYTRYYSNLKEIKKYVEPVKNELEKAFDVKVVSRTLSVVRWEPGDSLELHVDDLGLTHTNHMATLIYLNDDYEGGEIYFPTHGISLKPKAGDLLMFPGNMHYAHGVKPVISGLRYTMPMWFEFA